jgi:lysophospholipase L1-like esterase
MVSTGGVIATGGAPPVSGGSFPTGGAIATGGEQTSGGAVTSGGVANASGGQATAGGGSSAQGGGGAAAGGESSGGKTSPGGSANGGGGSAGMSNGSGGHSASGGSAGAAAGSAGASTGGAVDTGTLPALTLHLAGDSTVMTYEPSSAQEGWGQELGQFFLSKVTINNAAIGGASVQTFHASSRWTGIISKLKAGDYVMADFGINDSGTVAGRHVDPMPFQALFSQMNDEVRAKQANFIIVTSSALQYWSGGKETNARLEPYVSVLKTLGMTKNIPVADLNARSVEYLNSIGQTAAAQLYFEGDKAHFTKLGATQMAKFVVEELKRIASPLAAYAK